MGWPRRPDGRDDDCLQNFGAKRTRKRPLGNGDHRLQKGRFSGFGLRLPAQGSRTSVRTYFHFASFVCSV
jgi:hypothetical protein